MNVRVAVVDDAIVMRRVLAEELSSMSGVEVVWMASNGKDAVSSIERSPPDVMICDIEMHPMNGLETVRAVRSRGYRFPIVMFSSLSSSDARATIESLAAGATDYVAKPSGGLAAVREYIKREFGVRLTSFARSATGRHAAVRAALAKVGKPSAPRVRPSLILVGSSTGGPNALATFLDRLPRPLTVPVLISQHMPPVFTKMLAERLARESGLDVVEAEDSMPVVPGRVIIARGDRHLVLQKSVVRLDSGPPENSCRPSVDVMFRSALDRAPSTLAIVLTGMGRDGAEASRSLRGAGARVLVQDEATSVVWGMPGAVVKLGAADDVLPVEGIAETVCRWLAPFEQAGVIR